MTKFYVVNVHVIENCHHDTKEDKKYFMIPPYAEKIWHSFTEEEQQARLKEMEEATS